MQPLRQSANERASNLVRFGVFEVDLDSGELRKSGLKIRLQAKPFQILKALLEHPGDVLSREELRRRLWPDETFGDFESGLNTAINRVRTALGDSAEHPRYIETLARSGYRFIASLQHEVTPAMMQLSEEVAPAAAETPVVIAKRLRVRTVVVAATAAMIGSVCTLIFFWPRSQVAQFRQITFHRGNVFGARFSPDGQNVLYSAEWERGPHLVRDERG